MVVPRRQERGRIRRGWPSLIALVWIVMAISLMEVHAAAKNSDNLEPLIPESIDPACHSRFLKQAPAAWTALKDRCKGYEVRVKHHITCVDVRNLRVDVEWLFSVADDPRRKLAIGIKGMTVAAANERYSFKLQREKPNAPFKVKKVDAWELTDEPLNDQLLQAALSLPASMWSIWRVPFDYILENGDFAIVGSKCLVFEGNEVVRIAYRYQGKLIQEPYCQPGAIYWAELCPSLSWAVLRSGVTRLADGPNPLRPRMRTPGPLQVRVTSHYQDGFDGGPFPAEVQIEYEEVAKARLLEVCKDRLDAPGPCKRDLAEFFLPHYGISEYDAGLMSPAFSALEMVVVVADGFATVAIVFIAGASFWRRKRPPQAA